jgi:hypothetical protein
LDALHRVDSLRTIENVSALLMSGRPSVRPAEADAAGAAGASNLDTAHLSDREIADPILTAIGHHDAVQDLRDEFLARLLAMPRSAA